MEISVHSTYRRVLIAAAFAGVSLLLSSGCGSLAERFGGQTRANEMAAISSLKSIAAAQTNYSVEHGQYAASLQALASLVPADLAAGEKNGYRFSLKGSPSGFEATAVPAVPGSSGNRSFYEDATLVIRESSGPDPATAQSPDIEKRLGGN